MSNQIDLTNHEKVEDTTQLVSLVTGWHSKLVHELRAIVSSDQAIQFEEVNAPPRMATAEEAYGFRRGIIEVLERLELPFVAVIEDTQEEPSTE